MATFAIFLLTLLPVLSVPVVPAIDFYDHVSRYFVLSRLPGDAAFAESYQAAWGILPNIGLDVLGFGLMHVFPPLLTARLIVVLIIATQYFGVLFLNRQLTGRSSLLTAVLTGALIYSFILTWGFANFLLGLGLVFWAAGAWLALRKRALLATAVGSLFAVVIFLTHGVAFVLYGLLVGGLELGCLWQEGRLRIPALLRSGVMLAIQAALPVGLFAVSATSKSSDGFTNADESVRRLAGSGQLAHRLQDLVVYRLSTIYRVAETPIAWLDALTFVLVAAALAALCLQGRIRVERRAWIAIAIGVLLVAVTPPTVLGVGYVADRMPLFLAFVAVASLGVLRPRDRLYSGVVVAMAILAAIRLLVIGVDWQQYRKDFDNFQASAGTIPAGSVVLFVNASREGRLDPRPRCEMFGPLLVSTRHLSAPLFAYASQQPIKLRGRLATAQAGQPKSTGREDLSLQSDRIEAAVRQGAFDYLFVCDAQRLRRPLPAGASVANHVGRFSVVKARP